jgi:hypothetical protein
MNFGLYKVYAAEDINELLSHYESDLKTLAESPDTDPETLTRLAQALYLFKTGDFEGVFRRIEKSAVRANE